MAEYQLRKRAPRRQVTGAARVGAWGETSWRLELDCGHVSLRDRRPRSPVAACEQCYRENRGLPNLDETDIATLERRIALIGAVAQSALGTQSVTVTVVPGGFRVSAHVTEAEAEALLRR